MSLIALRAFSVLIGGSAGERCEDILGGCALTSTPSTGAGVVNTPRVSKCEECCGDSARDGDEGRRSERERKWAHLREKRKRRLAPSA